MVGEKADEEIEHSTRPNGVIPVAVEVVEFEAEGGHFLIGDLDAFGVFVLVVLGVDS